MRGPYENHTLRNHGPPEASCLSARRTPSRLAEPVPLGEPAPGCTEDEVLAGEQSQQVRRLLELISPVQRRVLELAYFGGLSQPEIAHQLGLPLGTVKGRMRLALNKLRIGLSDAPAPALGDQRPVGTPVS